MLLKGRCRGACRCQVVMCDLRTTQDSPMKGIPIKSSPLCTWGELVTVVGVAFLQLQYRTLKGSQC